MSDPDSVPASALDIRTVELQADASVLDAVGRGHTLASALADLIDNSIDAGANQVGIRFVTKNSIVRSIRISDDGCGMTSEQLKRAMSLGKQRAYSGASLGHFGVGLKGASFSQAKVLTVYSSTGYSPAAAMRLGRGQSGPDIIAEVFDSETAAVLLRRRGFEHASGTLAEWTQLEAVSRATTTQERRRWVESMILQVRDELGLTFHRMLADRRLQITLDEMDEDTGESGAPRLARPIDPLGFERWGAKDYPRTLVGRAESGLELHARCFLLPPNVDSAAVQPIGKTRRESQGLYVYRNDRLLHAGGWLGLRIDAPADLQLARVVLELDNAALDVVAINPEKHGVVLRPIAIQALERAAESGFTLRAFWRDAQDVWAESRKRALNAPPVAAPGAGAPAALRAVLEKTIGVRADDSVSVSFDWMPLDEAQLFAFEPPTGIVWLNAAHRELLEQDAAHLDSIKTSLYFMLEVHAGKERLGRSTAERLEAYQAVLSGSILPQHQAIAPELDLPPIGSPGPSPTVVFGRAEPAEPLGDPHVADVFVSSDVMDDFMRWTRKTVLLTAEDEVALGKRIEAGLFAGERLATQEDERVMDSATLDLMWVQHYGTRAKHLMVTSNIRLVMFVAKNYLHNGLELEDLVQEGVAGLIRAVEKFDYRQGTKFSTYAMWWIRQSITRAIADQGRLIRFPVHVVEKIPAITAAWDESTGGATQRIYAVAEATSQGVGLVRAVINNLAAPGSLDALEFLRTDSGAWLKVPLCDVLVDTEALDVDEHVAQLLLPAQIEDLLAVLDERSAEVIRLRFGIGGRTQRTLDQIGEAFGVTRERIRQLEKKAMTKLRSSVPTAELSLGGSLQPVMPIPLPATRTGDAVVVDAQERAAPPAAPAIPALEWAQVWPFLELYNAGHQLIDIAASAGVGERYVAWALATCLFGLCEGDDSPVEDASQGAHYDPGELVALNTAVEDGVSIHTVAVELGRTPFAVAWLLLEHGPRPRLTRKMLSAIRDKLQHHEKV